MIDCLLWIKGKLVIKMYPILCCLILIGRLFSPLFLYRCCCCVVCEGFLGNYLTKIIFIISKYFRYFFVLPIIFIGWFFIKVFAWECFCIFFIVFGRESFLWSTVLSFGYWVPCCFPGLLCLTGLTNLDYCLLIGLISIVEIPLFGYLDLVFLSLDHLYYRLDKRDPE